MSTTFSATNLKGTTSLDTPSITNSSGANITLNSKNLTSVGTITSGSNTVTGSINASVAIQTPILITTTKLQLQGAANFIECKGGAATDFIGTATLVNGVATVLNTNITTSDRIFVNRSAVNASTALGVFKVVKTASTNFVITACKPADGTTETGDLSTIEYFIVRQI